MSPFRSLRSRLLLSTAVPVLLFAGAAVVAFLTIGRLLDALDLEQHSQQVIVRAYALQADLTRMEAAKRGHHLLGQKAFKREYDASLAAAQKDFDELHRLAGDDAAHQEQFATLTGLMQSLRQLARQDFALLADPALLPATQWRHRLASLALERLDRLTRQAGEQLDALITAESERLAQRHALARQTTRESIGAIGLTIAGTLLLALLIPFQLSRTVLHPIERLQAAEGRMREGQFTPLPPEGPSEIAKLISHFNLMGLALSEREAQLHTSERRFRGLMGSWSHILWTTGPEGSLAEDGAGWRAFTGLTEEALGGEGWLAAVHPEERDRVAGAWRAALAERRTYEDEFRVRRHDGSWRVMACRAVPLFTPRGDLLEWVCTCTDVTEKKQEEELRQAKEAAEAANRAKTTFLTKMSHELRTPLNAVIGMSKMLSTRRFGPLNAKQADYLADVTRAGEHLLLLINDVLDLSKVEAGHMEVFPETVPVGPTVAGLVSTLRALAEAKSLQMVVEPPEPDGAVITDPARFKQVLFNLVSNAIKFTPEKGSVTVRCRWVGDAGRGGQPCPAEEAHGLRIDVTDTGLGIAPEHRARIWEEFRQVKNPGRVTEGTGLGLALTRRLVALLGGEVWLETSTPGAGSCFAFVLPLRVEGEEDSPPREQGSATALARAAGCPGKKLALVIEDHEPTSKLLADWLREAGLEATPAYDGLAGLERARRLHPSLILLDLRLPGLDGWQVLGELKTDPQTRDVPVVILSVTEGRAVPGNLPVADWFVKPLDREQFLARLRATCPGLFRAGRPLTALVVDDDSVARTWLRDLLIAEQIEVVEAAGGDEALACLGEQAFDLVLVDLLMPGVDGFAVVEAIRTRSADLPVVVVTSKDVTAEERERLNGHIQALLRKDVLTRERLGDRLRALGLPLTSRGLRTED